MHGSLGAFNLNLEGGMSEFHVGRLTGMSIEVVFLTRKVGHTSPTDLKNEMSVLLICGCESFISTVYWHFDLICASVLNTALSNCYIWTCCSDVYMHKIIWCVMRCYQLVSLTMANMTGTGILTCWIWMQSTLVIRSFQGKMNTPSEDSDTTDMMIWEKVMCCCRFNSQLSIK